jgi:hypothetical protein
LKDTVIYKFKSKVTGDLIMLEPDAKRLLHIMGKADQTKGILLAAQIADAMAAIDKAVAHEEMEETFPNHMEKADIIVFAHSFSRFLDFFLNYKENKMKKGIS